MRVAPTNISSRYYQCRKRPFLKIKKYSIDIKMYTFRIQSVEILSLNKILKIMESFNAIKPGPKPKREDGGLDERRRVAPPNKPKYDPPLKPEKPKK